MFDPHEDSLEPPPSSQTPVVFETQVVASERASRPTPTSGLRSTRPSLARRLAPFALLPVFVLMIAVLGGSSRHTGENVLGVDWKHVDAPKVDDVESLTPCPDGMALVVQGSVRVCIDRWEASLVEIGKSGGETSHSPYVTPNIAQGMKVKAVSKPGVVPQAYVSRYQASIACKNAGKRLCSGNEWRAACEGPSKTTYPYGEKHQGGTCNTKGKNPMAKLVGGGKNYLWGSAMQHPLLNTFPQTLAKTGEYAQCTNDFGVYDMVGNLHEWTADGAFRGGYYRDESVNGPGCRYQTTAHGPTYSDYSTGFRCCADPE